VNHHPYFILFFFIFAKNFAERDAARVTFTKCWKSTRKQKKVNKSRVQIRDESWALILFYFH